MFSGVICILSSVNLFALTAPYQFLVQRAPLSSLLSLRLKLDSSPKLLRRNSSWENCGLLFLTFYIFGSPKFFLIMFFYIFCGIRSPAHSWLCLNPLVQKKTHFRWPIVLKPFHPCCCYCLAGKCLREPCCKEVGMLTFLKILLLSSVWSFLRLLKAKHFYFNYRCSVCERHAAGDFIISNGSLSSFFRIFVKPL